MEIRRYVSGLLSSNMYLIVECDSAIVIDPFKNTSAADGLHIERIILTHEHYDHISGVNAWKQAMNVPVLCSKVCAGNLQDSRKNLSRYFSVFCELQTWIALDAPPMADENYVCCADEAFEDEMTLLWRGHQLKLMEMPGHSLGSIGILLDEAVFFSGDSLIEGRDIELNFPGGSKEKWQQIGAKRVTELPDGVRIYPGHFQDYFLRRKGGV